MRRGNTHTTTTAGAGRHHRDARRRSTGQARRRAVAASVALIVATVALAGCTGGDPAPDWTPTPATPIAQPTPTPSTDPATIKPERPTAMDTFDSAGAEATAIYYMQLVPYAYATGDLTELRELSAPECVFCGSVIDGVEKAVAAEQHTTGGVPTIGDVSSLETEPGAWWSVALDLTQASSRALDGGGELLAEYPEVSFHVDVAITHGADGWIVRALDHSEEPA